MPAEGTEVRVLFTEGHGHLGPYQVFVEVEDMDGNSLNVGTWEQHGPYRALRFTILEPDAAPPGGGA